MIVGFIIGFPIGCAVGLIIARSKISQKQISGYNSVQVQEILIDASASREVAELCASDNSSEKNKIFNEITKRINQAALKGAKRLYLENDYSLNERIRKYLTKTEIIEYFKPYKYTVHFIFLFENADIDFISWE